MRRFDAQGWRTGAMVLHDVDPTARCAVPPVAIAQGRPPGLNLAAVALAWSAEDGGAVAALDAELDA